MKEKKYSFDSNETYQVSDVAFNYSTSNVSSLELITQILGGAKAIGKKINNFLEFLSLSEKGLSIAVLMNLQKRMKFTNREMGKALEISESTLQRRLREGKRLDKKESESAIQLASLWAKGIEVFEDENDFRVWLEMNNTALGNNKPIELLHSPIGREEIKEVLNRIEWGIYS
ncbi:MAG: antitoxin Xre-like helix-turn-helix domain-containing protein [Bacteroidota bacterium]